MIARGPWTRPLWQSAWSAALVLTAAACAGSDQVGAPQQRRLAIAGVSNGELPLATGIVGERYEQQLTATGGDGSYRWTLIKGTLPRGMTLSSTGGITGTPSDTGTTRVTATVASAGVTADANLIVAVLPRLTIIQPTLPFGITGQPYRVQLEATRGAGSVRWSVVRGQLPTGIALSADGLLDGTPTVPDSMLLTIEAAGNGQVAQVTVPLVIQGQGAISVLQQSGVTFHVMSDSRRSRRFLLSTGTAPVDSALYLGLSADAASDSLDLYGANSTAVSILLRELQGTLTLGDTIAPYRATRLPTTTFTAPYQVPFRGVADSLQFCGYYWVAPTCLTGVLVHADSHYAYYEDTALGSGQRNSASWYREVARWNAVTEPILRRIWGVASDVDGNRRINIFVTNNIGPGGFMWNNCVGPGPIDVTLALDGWICLRSAVQELFNAGPMAVVTAQTGEKASAGFFAITQTTDAQEYVLWTQGSRFAGSTLWGGIWRSETYSRHNRYRGGWDPTLGNGISNMVRYIVTKAVDTLPDGTNIGGYFQADGWRYSCLASLRSCRVHNDTYVTPGMFGYWLWQHFGDGIGDRYTRAKFGDYYGDVWEQAVGLRGAHLFNMFFLSTVLDDTPIGRASGLEWPETPVPQKLPGVRSQMHELPLGTTGTYFATYSGPEIVRISKLKPNTSYILDVEFLSSTRTALTIVKP
ncbi:Ig domain-containing protein [Gemmatimonas sp.]|uniref:Ig domain-containing protein n=1 Tax=Gemmatimonas sp. TaxID=1962908 RepID=UPI0037C04E3E